MNGDIPADFEIYNDNEQLAATVTPDNALIYNRNKTIQSSNPVTLNYDSSNQFYYCDYEFDKPAKKIKLRNIDTSIIPTIELEKLTNKRLQSEITYTVSDLMSDQSKDGITKDSTLIVDLPDYPPIKPTIYYFRGSDDIETVFTDYQLISSLTYTTTFNYYGDDLSFYFGLNGTGRIQLTKEPASGTTSIGFYILRGNISLPNNTKEVVLHLYDSSKNELFKFLLTQTSSGNNTILFGFNKYFNLSYKNNQWLGN